VTVVVNDDAQVRTIDVAVLVDISAAAVWYVRRVLPHATRHDRHVQNVDDPIVVHVRPRRRHCGYAKPKAQTDHDGSQSVPFQFTPSPHLPILTTAPQAHGNCRQVRSEKPRPPL